MKRNYLTMLMLTAFWVGTYAQGAKTVGAHLAYGTKDLNLGFGGRFEADVTKNLSIVPNATYYYGKSEYGYSSTIWTFDVDAHYYFTTNGLNFYALSGLVLNNVTQTIPSLQGYSGSTESEKKFGLNLGGGVNLSQIKKFIPFIEVRYNTAFQAVLVTAGVSIPAAVSSQKKSGYRKRRR